MEHSPLDANAMQHRIVLEQVAEAAVTKFRLENPDLFQRQTPKADIPAPLKWAGGLIGAAMTALGIMSLNGAVTSINDMRIAVAEVKLQITMQNEMQKNQMADLERRVTKLETEKKP